MASDYIGHSFLNEPPVGISLVGPWIGELNDDRLSSGFFEVVSEDQSGVTAHDAHIAQLQIVDLLCRCSESGTVDFDTEDSILRE